MDNQNNSTLLFLVSTPQPLDQRSRELLASEGKSHAAKISHPVNRSRGKVEANAAAGTESREIHLSPPPPPPPPQRPEQVACFDCSLRSPTHCLLLPRSEVTDPSEDLWPSNARSTRSGSSRPPRTQPHLGSRNVRLQTQRRRHNQENATKPCLPVLRLDPLYWLPYEKDQSTYEAVDYFTNIVVPAQEPIYEILNVTSSYISFSFACLTNGESSYHAATADMLVTSEQLRNPGCKPSLSVLFHQARAIEWLRREISNLKQPTNAVLGTILFLIVLDITTGGSSYVNLHGDILARLVALRGGLDALGHEGFDKAAFMQFDYIWSLAKGSSLLAPPTQYAPIFPSHPFSQWLVETITLLPTGFQNLVRQCLLPFDTIELLSRVGDAGRRSKGSSIYVPLEPDKNPFHSQRRKYNSFSDAVPCLLAPEEVVPPLLKNLSLALILWCNKAYYDNRASSMISVGSRRVLTTRLLELPPPATASKPRLSEATSSDEKDCTVWVWLMALDSWRLDDGHSLHYVGRELLAQLKQQFPRETADLDVLDSILVKFFWTDDLRAGVRTYWDQSSNVLPCGSADAANAASGG
ncbi:uncharacterized protein Z518_07893 [Rhinocladiella mackenziei CBS 650.93]|uniref:Transcription factor domain-containing protein n=1 Tax=Rhinocladiella mackenziei CBS 650.93 TaxID=1442369 RepID=A0A0D2I7Y7_9EURO|nr:uncharacterized protein Z518_07893 [Rhinocladiella mackenziei CBS 650.93]KIX01954.1 hypothetical protein Z518_07893 [Rhinocladiella mackenziei CBS 650.93]